MPTSRLFGGCPPFPADAPVLNLPTISLRKLQQQSPEEEQALFKAGQEWGFFVLRLDDSPEGRVLLENAENMFDLTTETFALGESVLDKHAYNAPFDLTGYKRKGKLRTDDGKMDCMELYTISQYDMLGNRPARENAAPIEAKREDISTFIKHASEVVCTILGAFDTQLQLPRGTLSSLCLPTEISETSVRLLQAQPQSGDPYYDNISLGGHTDIGLITLLFNAVGGLQILPAKCENKFENWAYIKPELGCIAVNLADTSVEWTGGLLCSSLHRVVTAPGQQALVPRQSLAYPVRPRSGASMQRIQGGLIPPVQKSEPVETRSVNEWAAWRSKQIMMGELKPQTRGGVTY